MNILQLSEKVRLRSEEIVLKEKISYGLAYKIAYKELKNNWR